MARGRILNSMLSGIADVEGHREFAADRNQDVALARLRTGSGKSEFTNSMLTSDHHVCCMPDSA